ncbi:polysaccharide pyruvyl transferase family protein [Pseudonocardia kujensis]|uniref:polysaccharide pyruvyl transferase family protein n=1 Tax=Pseudonocardia kujensis TaxID=1128675 RepID=UPI001E35B3A3|nr:polysaccharide pyruvyl transferase family protein [Pseudonocardia kujensis]MCE0763124.1 polysaccharide pyruvyl transferase family protein [Pseudonocardia kujensis]
MTARVRRSDAAGRPHVVVQNGEYWLRNNGDLAMLEVTVGRLRARWPDARITVLTSAPSLLSAYLPGVEPLSDGRFRALAKPAWTVAERLGPRVVGPLSAASLDLRKRASERLRSLRPGPADRTAPGPSASQVHELPALPTDVARAIEDASLLLAIGGGYLTDVDPDACLRTFAMLAHARDAGVPSAVVGQGLGPLTDPGLRALAAQALPTARVIALREGRRGPKLLEELDVPADRVVVTGDDAIELSYAARRTRVGRDIGVCLRVAEYSPVAAGPATVVGEVVRAAAAARSAALVPLIISEYRSEDRRSTLPLLEGAPRAAAPLGPFVRASEVAAEVGRCRILVTGAYHLAVFALAQGIPVVGLTSSTYYDDKFLGLAEMFDGGVDTVRLTGPGLHERLTDAVTTAWDRAPGLREPLRGRAREQIASSRAVLDDVLSVVER